MAPTSLRHAAPADHASAPQHVILGMALGYLASRSLHVAAELGIADLLGDGPKSVEELALATGADRPALYRLLRMLAGHGVFAEDADGRIRLTPAAELLQSGVPGSLHDAVKMIGDVAGDGSWWSAVGRLRHSVLSGEPGFHQVHGIGFFEYLTRHPGASAWFDRGLANFATAENPAIADACDWAEVRRIVDVGGGQGGFLAEVLKRCPAATGVLYDLPHVVREPAALAAAGLLGRCEIVGGDFFRSVPAGGDAYILKRILHDWNDQCCVQILHTCRAAMGESSRVLVVDAVIPPGNDPHPGKDMDILMMALTEGRERTEAEFRELYQHAGLTLTRIVPTPSVLSIVEGRPA
ncbi:methyltransferase [Microvirga massiliensis]|uniref:methyltransferase n=1 Tax=Microvirga massiliensis TaxID=1033741 RepID=UPI00062BB462|nr:methyltransferase [Microvirga massiliensis]